MRKERFWIFGGETCYPEGGMSDFLRSFSDREVALGFALGFKHKSGGGKWAQLYDSETGEINTITIS
jgi:hypothetical protein